MPTMGKPINFRAKAFQNVKIAPKQIRPQNIKQLEENQKKKLLDKLTGFKEKSIYRDGAKHNKMGKDEFLRLLTYQLENQDPMNPMNQSKMTGELAQFSQLEQLSNLNTKFDALQKTKGMEDKFYGASFLGKEVVTTGSSVKFEGEGSESSVLFTLPENASKVRARFFDQRHNLIAEIWKENIGRGNQTITWDGESLDRSIARRGEYTTQVDAWDDNLDAMKVSTKVKGHVDSVFFENGETVLLVDGKKVFLRDVDSFHVPKLSKTGHAESNLPTGKKVERNLQLNNTKPVRGGQEMAMGRAQPSPKPRTLSTGITDVYDVE